MTEFQYLFLREALSELRAEGIDVPPWNSVEWINTRSSLGDILMVWLGQEIVIHIYIEREKVGFYKIGNVTWKVEL